MWFLPCPCDALRCLFTLATHPDIQVAVRQELQEAGLMLGMVPGQVQHYNSRKLPALLEENWKTRMV